MKHVVMVITHFFVFDQLNLQESEKRRGCRVMGWLRILGIVRTIPIHNFNIGFFLGETDGGERPRSCSSFSRTFASRSALLFSAEIL